MNYSPYSRNLFRLCRAPITQLERRKRQPRISQREINQGNDSLSKTSLSELTFPPAHVQPQAYESQVVDMYFTPFSSTEF